MCGRYQLDAAAVGSELERIIEDVRRRAARQHPQRPVKTQGELFPGDRVPVICRSRSGELGAFAMALPPGRSRPCWTPARC